MMILQKKFINSITIRLPNNFKQKTPDFSGVFLWILTLIILILLYIGFMPLRKILKF